KAAKPKVVTTGATTATTTRPKDRGVVIKEPSEFRVPQETQPSSSKDKGKGTDIAKITRKRSKPNKRGHGNGKECTRAERMLSKSNIG
ncbi:hypothetical protein Tco_0248670, partial [Tanacetum coccineum]